MDGAVADADYQRIGAVEMMSDGALPVGLDADTGEPVALRASKFNRHTFWCGQSGSGKTYALAVVLEQLLLYTRLPVVVFDPNSDFVHLDQVHDEPAGRQTVLGRRDIRIARPGSSELALQVRFRDMPARSRAAVMAMDPVLDASDFNAALHLESALQSAGAVMEGRLVEWLRADPDPARQRLAMRLENLGIADWSVWAWGRGDVCDVIDDEPDATVLDLGGFAERGEAAAAALAVLDHLWERRAARRPRLLVIDEAHNLCPPDPATPVERLLTERLVQIAAEGRKYGLWLLLSTQRPSKIHPNVLSQCDNLALMRINSKRDLDALATTFGFVPERLIGRVAGFGLGEALFAGGFCSEPHVVRMASRLTREGGGDVAVPLRDLDAG